MVWQETIRSTALGNLVVSMVLAWTCLLPEPNWDLVVVAVWVWQPLGSVNVVKVVHLSMAVAVDIAQWLSVLSAAVVVDMVQWLMKLAM